MCFKLLCFCLHVIFVLHLVLNVLTVNNMLYQRGKSCRSLPELKMRTGKLWQSYSAQHVFR